MSFQSFALKSFALETFAGWVGLDCIGSVAAAEYDDNPSNLIFIFQIRLEGFLSCGFHTMN